MNNHVSEETLSEHHPWHKRCWRSENWADILTEWPQDVVQNTTPNPPLTVPDTDTLFVDQQTLSSFCCTILFLKLPCVCQSVVSVWPWGPDVWRRRRLVLFYDTWPCISFDFVPPCCTGEVGVCVGCVRAGGFTPTKRQKKELTYTASGGKTHQRNGLLLDHCNLLHGCNMWCSYIAQMSPRAEKEVAVIRALAGNVLMLIQQVLSILLYSTQYVSLQLLNNQKT